MTRFIGVTNIAFCSLCPVDIATPERKMKKEPGKIKLHKDVCLLNQYSTNRAYANSYIDDMVINHLKINKFVIYNIIVRNCSISVNSRIFSSFPLMPLTLS